MSQVSPETIKATWMGVDVINSQVSTMGEIINQSNQRRAELSETDFHADFSLTHDQSENLPVLDWPGKEQDFAIIDEAVLMVCGTSEQSDAEFRTKTLPRLKEQCLKSRLFRLLDDDTIPRNQAHLLRTPLEHVFKVLFLLKTDNLSPEDRIKLRYDAMMHDLGKIFIAQADSYSYHARISYTIMMDYMTNRHHFEQLEAQRLAMPVLFHHLIELIDRKTITVDEFEPIAQAAGYYDPELIQLIGVLTVADTGSVEGYEHYMIGALEIMVKLAEHLVSQVKDDILAIIRIYIHGLRETFKGNSEYLGQLNTISAKVA